MAKKHQRTSFEGVQVSAKFDNARRTPDTESLFRNVDSLAMIAALDPTTRRTIRDRARYVVLNCPYAWGMLDTHASYVVGSWVSASFPRGGVPKKVRDKLVRDFDAWALKVGLWEKLRTMVRAKTTDGEAFAVFFTDPTITDRKNHVKLNLAVIECDRVESWTETVTRENERDGIRFDPYGHPTEYRILKYHPGDYRVSIKNRKGEWTKAANVIHYFDMLRPEQVRGVSDFVSALEIPADQKSYRSSVTTSAINAANISGVLETDLVPECFDDEDASIGKCAMEVKPNTVFRMQRGALLTIPEGWKIHQLQAQQPTSLYPDFVRSLIAEMARCLSMPVNIAMCDSSQHNFASAKIDHTVYGDKINSIRSTLATKVLDRIFFNWLEEYAIRESIDEKTMDALADVEWLFMARGNADVMKDAAADNTRLGNASLSYETLYAKDGKDWKREVRQALSERAQMLAWWREECKTNGLPEETPCPFFAKNAGAAKPAPTEDQVEHESQRNRNPNNRAKAN